MREGAMTPPAGTAANAGANNHDPPRWTTGQILLGLFVTWQLVFLLGANLLGFIKHIGGVAGDEEPIRVVEHLSPGLAEERGHLYELYRIFRRWEQIINQDQYWRLFAPGIADYSTFVFVELRWDDAAPGAAAAAGVRPPVILRSPNEPDNVHHFIRWTHWRLRRYEGFLEVDLRPEPDESEVQTRERLRGAVRRRLRKDGDTVFAYLNWRWTRYHAEHLDCPLPRQVILHNRSYGVPLPEERGPLRGPYEMPIARWLPQATHPEGVRPVQLYDPVARTFQYPDR